MIGILLTCKLGDTYFPSQICEKPILYDFAYFLPVLGGYRLRLISLAA